MGALITTKWKRYVLRDLDRVRGIAWHDRISETILNQMDKARATPSQIARAWRILQ
jgi:hypothetical protein